MHLFFFLPQWLRPAEVKPMTFRLTVLCSAKWTLQAGQDNKDSEFYIWNIKEKQSNVWEIKLSSHYRTSEFLLLLKRLKAICLPVSVVQCPHPTQLFMTYSPDTSVYDFNTTVSVMCITGYNLTEGSETRTCQHTGDWDGTPPVCTSMYFSYSVLEHSYISSSFLLFFVFFPKTHTSPQKKAKQNKKNWYLFCWQNISFKHVSATR